MADVRGQHLTHCCPIHGCKYAHPTDCPVATGEARPFYAKNNGCEQCEAVAGEVASMWEVETRHDSGEWLFEATHELAGGMTLRVLGTFKGASTPDTRCSLEIEGVLDGAPVIWAASVKAEEPWVRDVPGLVEALMDEDWLRERQESEVV